jgi:nucleotide-binding universal stress UspA family protein
MEVVMIRRPLVLCPIDFSEGSCVSLRHAAAMAEYFQSDLLVATVNDPLLNDVDGMSSGEGHLAKETVRELEWFYRKAFDGVRAPVVRPRFTSAVGHPAHEILAMSDRDSADLIVMSSRGASSMRKMFFGSTAERVLRETTVPVLVTPPDGLWPAHVVDVGERIRRILVPVDLSNASADQMRTALSIAGAVDVPVLVLHVLEPIRSNRGTGQATPSIANERRDRAERALESLAEMACPGVRVEPLIGFGEPSEEIAKIARDRDARLIVIGLHASPMRGPRMGSVTYRVLCLSHVPVLALPPLPTASFAPHCYRREVAASAGPTVA